MHDSKAYHRAYYLAHREETLTKMRAAYALDPEKGKAARQRSAARWEKMHPIARACYRKGIDPQTVTAKPEVCDVCGKKPRGKARLCLDHCHARGGFRGWLCHHCNTALGQAQDDPALLRKLANYLEMKQ